MSGESLKIFLIICSLLSLIVNSQDLKISTTLTKIWGPGLIPHLIVMPARYFFIQAVDKENNSVPLELENVFEVVIEGVSKTQKQCRLWVNTLNRKDGSYIVRYKLYEPCVSLKISVKLENEHIAASPYIINEIVNPDDCDCPSMNIDKFLNIWNCGSVPRQILEDLNPFPKINWDETREKVIQKFNQPHSISMCHYIVKENLISRTCYGKYVGFKMFMDNILLSLSRKIKLPDLEFFVNLGDWPLIQSSLTEKFPMLSWCGSTETFDIVMPTYDITESTLENMGRVMLDMLSVQGNVKEPWHRRVPKAFWRGRDSNQHRLDLIDISRRFPDLFNVSLTNFFFFRDKQEEYGPKSTHVSFFDFFQYKYQLALDGTVAAYRFPYLLAGGSLVIKQESKYYEHFYNELVPYQHYIPVRKNLSDLIEKINWAIEHDEQAQLIGQEGQKFANENLLPDQIFCYHAHLLNELHKRTNSKIRVLEGMERVEHAKPINCDCPVDVKDEL